MSHAASTAIILGCLLVLGPATAGEKADKPRPLEIPSQVSGVLTQVMVKEGTVVRRGDVLARMDDRLAQVEVRKAQARAVQAEIELEAAKNRKQEADVRHQAIEELAKKGAASQEEVSAAKITRATLEAQLRVVMEEVQIRRLDAERARIIQDRHVMVSPVDGVVQSVLKQPGEAAKALTPVMRIQAAK
jgi:multidrug resistance efflux pump